MSRTRGPHNATLPLQDLVDKKSTFDLPLDVIMEVCQHLEPPNILHLARTTKVLRAFLLNRHRSRHVWRTAFGNAPNLPPCPDHLSEPTYTHLAFFPECHGCFEHCNAILWELRMRCCEICLSKITVFSPELPSDETRITNFAVNFLPCAVIHLKLNERNLSIDEIKLTSCHRPSDWEDFFTRVNDGTPMDPLAGTEASRWRPFLQHAKLCREWERAQLRAEGDRIKLVRQERAAKIRKNLEALGWIDDIFYSTCFLELPEVCKPEPLTSAEWHKISRQIVMSLPQVRLAQIAKNYHRRLEQFTNILCNIKVELEVAPRAIDLVLELPIREVLETSLDPEIGHSTSQRLRRHLPKLMRWWSRDAVNELASFAERQLGPDSTMDRGNILFTCTKCQLESNRSHPHMDFDTALTHFQHLYPGDAVAVDMNGAMHANRSVSEIYEEVVEEFGPHRSLEVLRVNKEASEDMARLSKSLGGRVFISPTVELS